MVSQAITTFAEQINLAQHAAMQNDSEMLAFGLGIDDPKAIFNTTQKLAETFGPKRVFDMPTSENAMTGVGIGAAIAGSRVLMTHQRFDFFLLAMDQLVNNAAKWHYMFNGQMTVPITIRLIVGRGWGQGPTHAQNLQSWFAHVPGLKVVVPSRTEHVGRLLYQSLMDRNPTIFIEHRWLHNQNVDATKCDPYDMFDNGAQLLKEGQGVTLIASSYMVPEALHAAQKLAAINISCDIIELTRLDRIDWSLLTSSVNKTGRVIICETARKAYSCSAEIAASLTELCFSKLKLPPIRIGLPDYPEPTSFGLTKDYYPSADTIVSEVIKLFSQPQPAVTPRTPHDVPGEWFKGPF